MTHRRAIAASSLLAGLLFLVAVAAAQAATYVDDSAGMFKPETISAIEARDASLQSRTGKAVTVITVKTTNGEPVNAAATTEARKRALNGALIYIARDDRQLSISYGANTAALFPPALQTSIKQALRASFRQGNYDDGILTAVDSISGVIASGASGGHGPQMPAQSGQPARSSGIGWIWWVLVLIVGFFIIRALTRRPSMPPGAAAGGQPTGYGPGGVPPQSSGSGFFPSLLGGAAGAYIGSELADRDRDRGDVSGATGAAASPPIESDSSSDAGQGFSDSGGSGDFSGGDSGGGGGDSGGGW